jgi:hypothetical protein
MKKILIHADDYNSQYGKTMQSSESCWRFIPLFAGALPHGRDRHVTNRA